MRTQTGTTSGDVTASREGWRVYQGLTADRLRRHVGFDAARALVLVGTVGGLAPRLQAADLIVPTVSRGTHSAWTYHRVDPPDVSPDPVLAASLAGRLRAAGVGVAEGPTTTCEALFAETCDDVATWSAAGYLGVEMEAALTFAVGAHVGIPAAAVLYVTDDLIAEIGFFDAAHADSADARHRARRPRYGVAQAELLDRVQAA